jgi:hypothetical protein
VHKDVLAFHTEVKDGFKEFNVIGGLELVDQIVTLESLK